jgi:hypothetical protein
LVGGCLDNIFWWERIHLFLRIYKKLLLLYADRY